jgi:hypothetical protein
VKRRAPSRGTVLRRFRFPRMTPNTSYTLMAMGGAVLVAALIGIQLGESAVGQINPVYFQGAAVHPRDRGAAIDPNALPPAESRFANAYDWGDGNAARAADRVNVAPGTPAETYAFVAPPPVTRLAGPAWRDTTPPAELDGWSPGEVGRARRQRDADIERYANYPIEEKPAAEQTRPVEDYRAADVYEDDSSE